MAPHKDSVNQLILQNATKIKNPLPLYPTQKLRGTKPNSLEKEENGILYTEHNKIKCSQAAFLKMYRYACEQQHHHSGAVTL